VNPPPLCVITEKSDITGLPMSKNFQNVLTSFNGRLVSAASRSLAPVTPLVCSLVPSGLASSAVKRIINKELHIKPTNAQTNDTNPAVRIIWSVLAPAPVNWNIVRMALTGNWLQRRTATFSTRQPGRVGGPSMNGHSRTGMNVYPHVLGPHK